MAAPTPPPIGAGQRESPGPAPTARPASRTPAELCRAQNPHTAAPQRGAQARQRCSLRPCQAGKAGYPHIANTALSDTYGPPLSLTHTLRAHKAIYEKNMQKNMQPPISYKSIYGLLASRLIHYSTVTGKMPIHLFLGCTIKHLVLKVAAHALII